MEQLQRLPRQAAELSLRTSLVQRKRAAGRAALKNSYAYWTRLRSNISVNHETAFVNSSRESRTENVGLEPMRLLPAFALRRRVQCPYW